MAQVIDALFVTLGLDAANFKKGTKETTDALKKTAAESTKTSKEMEAWGKNAAAGLSKLRNEALGLLAVFTAGVGIKNFVENTITSTASLGRMSENLNMSAKDLAMWQLANKNAGGSVEGMTAQLKEAAGEVAKFKMGQGSDSAQWFYRMGGDQAALKDGNTYLLARAKIVSDLFKKDPTRAATVAANMGISEDTFNLIKQDPEEIDRLRQAQARLAAEQAAASVPMDEFRKKLDTLKNNFEAVGVKILTALMPQFDRFANWVAEHQADIETWANRAIVAIERFVKWADDAAESVGGWKTVLMGIAAISIISMVGPMLSFAAALLNVGTALGVIGGAAGVSALGVLGKLGAVGAAGYGGWKLGGLAYDNMNEKDQNSIGKTVAMVLAALGNEEAKASLKTNEGTGAAGSPGVSGAAAMFAKLEAKHGLPSGLLDSVWAQESGRGKNMRSPVGAKGHFQFMDATAKQYGLTNPDDLGESADAAARMYRDLLKQNGGSLPKALAGYNWGQGNLQRKGLGAAPLETQNYLAQVQARMGRNQGGGTSTSETNINGPITINTQATDAKGIARDMGQQLGKVAFASQANTGLQ